MCICYPLNWTRSYFRLPVNDVFWHIAVLFPCDQYHKDKEFNREMSFLADINVFKGSAENLTNFEKVHQQFIFGLFFEKTIFHFIYPYSVMILHWPLSFRTDPGKKYWLMGEFDTQDTVYSQWPAHNLYLSNESLNLLGPPKGITVIRAALL